MHSTAALITVGCVCLAIGASIGFLFCALLVGGKALDDDSEFFEPARGSGMPGATLVPPPGPYGRQSPAPRGPGFFSDEEIERLRKLREPGR